MLYKTDTLRNICFGGRKCQPPKQMREVCDLNGKSAPQIWGTSPNPLNKKQSEKTNYIYAYSDNVFQNNFLLVYEKPIRKL